MTKNLTNLKADAAEITMAAPKITMGVNMGNFMLAFNGANIVASNGTNALLIPLAEFKKILTDNEPSFLTSPAKNVN